MPVILSVALENHPGSLGEVLSTLASNDINVEAIEAEAQGDFGRVVILTKEPNKAAGTLRSQGFDVVEADALELRLQDRPGELSKVVRTLASNRVNIVSLFGTTPTEGKGRLILRVNNAEAARKALGLKEEKVAEKPVARRLTR